jgi:hypothetical protein
VYCGLNLEVLWCLILKYLWCLRWSFSRSSRGCLVFSPSRTGFEEALRSISNSFPDKLIPWDCCLLKPYKELDIWLSGLMCSNYWFADTVYLYLVLGNLKKMNGRTKFSVAYLNFDTDQCAADVLANVGIVFAEIRRFLLSLFVDSCSWWCMFRNNFAVFLSDEEVAGYGRSRLHVSCINSSRYSDIMWDVGRDGEIYGFSSG